MTAPLTPAEALALAVRLRLHVDVSRHGVSVWYWRDGEEAQSCDEWFDDKTDRLAATCRAIARAARELEGVPA